MIYINTMEEQKLMKITNNLYFRSTRCKSILNENLHIRDDAMTVKFLYRTMTLLFASLGGLLYPCNWIPRNMICCHLLLVWKSNFSQLRRADSDSILALSLWRQSGVPGSWLNAMTLTGWQINDHRC